MIYKLIKKPEQTKNVFIPDRLVQIKKKNLFLIKMFHCPMSLVNFTDLGIHVNTRYYNETDYFNELTFYGTFYAGNTFFIFFNQTVKSL